MDVTSCVVDEDIGLKTTPRENDVIVYSTGAVMYPVIPVRLLRQDIFVCKDFRKRMFLLVLI